MLPDWALNIRLRKIEPLYIMPECPKEQCLFSTALTGPDGKRKLRQHLTGIHGLTKQEANELLKSKSNSTTKRSASKSARGGRRMSRATRKRKGKRGTRKGRK